MEIIVTISFFLFLIFNAYCWSQYGILDSYSAYGDKFYREQNKINIWSLSTIITAFLLIPPMLEVTDGNTFQFLSFFAPANLFIVGFTPDYKTSKRKKIIHYFFAILSAIMIGIWVCIINHYWIIFLSELALWGITALFCDIKKNWMYFLELAFYASTYAVLDRLII